MSHLTMRGYVVKASSETCFLGNEGENNSRTLEIRTVDDLSDYATVNLLIDTLDCGAMTVTASGSYNVLSMTLTAEMLGDAGVKTCQLLMMDAGGTVILKSNQFLMEVRASNEIESAVSGSSTVVIISDYIKLTHH